MQQKREKRKIRRNATIILMLLILLISTACRLFSKTETSPEPVVEEPIITEDVETEETEPEEDVWQPEVIYNLNHDDIVNSVAYSHDGSKFATGLYIQIKIWDAADGSLLKEIEANHSVEDMTFLPDDQSVATGVSLGGVNTYSITTGELITKFHGGYDNFLTLSPDGSLIATGNRDGILWLWRVEDGELVAEMDPAITHEDYSEYIRSLAFSPDGQHIAAGHWGGDVFLWDALNYELKNTLSIDDEYAEAWDLAFSPDGQYLAVGGARMDFEDFIAIWDVETGEIAYSLNEFSRSGSMHAPVAFSPDGTLLAAGAVDGIYIWALPEFEFVNHLPIEETVDSDWVTDLTFSPDSQKLLASYWGGYAQLWQLQPPE
jgi:WD40 repeat protein